MCCGARAWRRVMLVAVFLLMGLAAQAQEQPKQAQEQPKYEVSGFRDARFGMTEAEVRAAVKKSFAVRGAAPRRRHQVSGESRRERDDVPRSEEGAEARHQLHRGSRESRYRENRTGEILTINPAHRF